MTTFYLLAGVAIAASLLVVTQRNPIYGVLLLIASFGALSGLYIMLDSPFVAVIQIVVYAGAIMVLFLFVVMLLNAPREGAVRGEGRPAPAHPGPVLFGAVLGLLLAGELVWAIAGSRESGVLGGPAMPSVGTLGRLLFTTYAFPFEVTSLLILVAMLGAVVMARSDRSARRR
jgi:NADH-quinone oxidoreductase subunit J